MHRNPRLRQTAHNLSPEITPQIQIRDHHPGHRPAQHLILQNAELLQQMAFHHGVHGLPGLCHKLLHNPRIKRTVFRSGSLQFP